MRGIESFQRGARLLLACGLLAAPAAEAGELRVLLEGDAGLRSDGNALQAAAEGEAEPRHEHFARAGLRLGLSYALRRLDLALDYAPAYERSLEDAQLDGLSHRLGLSLVAKGVRSTVRVAEQLLKTPGLELASQPALIAPDTLLVPRRGDQLSQLFDVGYTFDVNRRNAWNAGARHAVRSFEHSDLVDSTTYGLYTGWSWQVRELRSVALQLAADHTEYQQDRSADAATLGLGYEATLSRDLHVRAEGGLFAVETTGGRVRRPVFEPPQPEEPGADEELSETGWRAGLALDRRGELLGWAVALRHDISPGIGRGEPIVLDSAFAALTFAAGRRVTFGLNGQAARHRDLRDDAVATEFLAGSVRADWRFLPAAGLTAAYTRVWQESDAAPIDDLSYDRYEVGLRVRLWQSGEKPRDPGHLGEPEDEEPVAP
ncbi:MAG TPA: hypothetical protein VF121_03835 [Thermoanaerobaculia bacterium]|nr:hypothetical protein [Thermoanaerobaculia bacterium]